MAPKIITRCTTQGCDSEVVLSRDADNGPVTGECIGCGASWRLTDGKLHRLSPRMMRPARS